MIIVKQIGIMFVLVFAGYLLFRSRKISTEGSRTLANILVYAVIPCVIVKSFLVEYTYERLKGLILSAVLALMLLVIAMLISHVIFRKNGVAAFASAFSNAGFFGVPLIGATIGEEAVFYAASFIAFLNLFQWTFGVSMISGRMGRITARRVLTAPFMMSVVAGFCLFLGQVELPVLLTESLKHIANLNTPLAMFAIGIYLAQIDIKKMFQSMEMYRIAIIRLIVIPLISAAVLMIIPNGLLQLKYALMLAAACPVGANVAIYAQMYEADYGYAVQTVVISTILCILTMPFVTRSAQWLWAVS